MCELAKKMKDAYDNHTPYELKDDEVHCPFFKHVNIKDIDTILTSVALCAQVSYRKENSEPETVKRIINMLLTAERLHASPFEHICTPMTAEEVAFGLQKGNLKGFKQLRHIVEELPPEYKSYDGIVDYFKK